MHPYSQAVVVQSIVPSSLLVSQAERILPSLQSESARHYKTFFPRPAAVAVKSDFVTRVFYDVLMPTPAGD
ncbi:hypothetical protein EV14_0185 [Prochlorococcus sp. MIT 0703]|nr:hypothetical protein EV12_1552 [Prochlorococcus sp. MIT 0701]KGG36673.1 hypothetical protein EV14_0185 [Prochlorococcus sp. MIT 0703]